MAQPRPLTQDQMEGDPAAVAGWLRENASKADRKTAALFAKDGARARAKGRWSAAYKSYGESALLYPDPAVLLEVVHVAMLELASVRAHEKRPDLIGSDASRFLKLYQVTLAAQGVLGTLSKSQLAEVEHAIRCLSVPDAASRPAADCEPLKAYRIEFERVSRQR